MRFDARAEDTPVSLAPTLQRFMQRYPSAIECHGTNRLGSSATCVSFVSHDARQLVRPQASAHAPSCASGIACLRSVYVFRRTLDASSGKRPSEHRSSYVSGPEPANPARFVHLVFQ